MISVVTAVLNTEKYIGECLKSAVDQTYDDLEIIVVDGGSTDGTLDIIKEYEKSDSRIKLVACPQKSYGAQMNLGFSVAGGDYIAILEADDKLPKNAYEILMGLMEKTDADIVKGDYDTFITNSKGEEIHDRVVQFELIPEVYGKLVNSHNRTDILENDLYLWRGLYKASFLKSNEIGFNETAGAALQDQGFIIRSLAMAKSVYYSKECVYFYRKDNEGSSVYSSKCMTYLADEYEKITAFVRSLGEDEAELYLPHIYRRLLLLVRTRYSLKAVFSWDLDFPSDSVRRLQGLLRDAQMGGYLGKCMRYQRDLQDLSLFIEDEKAYERYVCDAIKAERNDLEGFINRIKDYPTLILWGCGRNEGMLRMILDKRGMKNRIVRADTDEEKIKASPDIFDAREIAAGDEGEGLYIVCASFFKYQIRSELHDRYGIAYNRIVFYELGTAHYLLWM